LRIKSFIWFALSLLVLAVFMSAPAPAVDKTARILVFGDSLVAGYQLQPGQAFPDRLAKLLNAGGCSVEVVNAGLSGDTTAGGLARLDWIISGGDKFDLALVELGANDMLRGLDPGQAEANLEGIIKKLKAKGIKVLLCGMKAPLNMGDEYRRQFDGMYARLAERHQVALYPFFLEGVAGIPP
jgi:acyl-CoA thioesterase-1